MLKVVFYLKENTKPIVFTCNEEKDQLICKLNQFMSTNSCSPLLFDSGDVLLCKNKDDIKCVLITTDKKDD